MGNSFTARKFVFVIFAAIINLSSQAQVQPLKGMDEIRADLKKAGTDTAKARQLLCLSLFFVYKEGSKPQDIDTALLLLAQAEKIIGQVRDKRLQAECYFVYSSAFQEAGKKEEGRRYIDRSLAIYKTITDPGGMAESLVELATYYSAWEDSTLAFQQGYLEQ